eukprot:Pgem_evm1s440
MQYPLQNTQNVMKNIIQKFTTSPSMHRSEFLLHALPALVPISISFPDLTEEIVSFLLKIAPLFSQSSDSKCER